MKKPDCETIKCAALARMDGELSPLSEEVIQDHLRCCQTCREELAELGSALLPLDTLKRNVFEDDLWPGIEAGLMSPVPNQRGIKHGLVFSIFGLLLLAMKALEVSPTALPGPMIKLVSVMMVITFFLVLKQNPFRICEDLSVLHDSESFCARTEMEDIS